MLFHWTSPRGYASVALGGVDNNYCPAAQSSPPLNSATPLPTSDRLFDIVESGAAPWRGWRRFGDGAFRQSFFHEQLSCRSALCVCAEGLSLAGRVGQPSAGAISARAHQAISVSYQSLIGHHRDLIAEFFRHGVGAEPSNKPPNNYLAEHSAMRRNRLPPTPCETPGRVSNAIRGSWLRCAS